MVDLIVTNPSSQCWRLVYGAKDFVEQVRFESEVK